MSLPLRQDPLIQRLTAARPADPCAPDAERAAVRVLARLAVQDAGDVQVPAAPARHRRLLPLAAAACILIGLVLWPTAVSHTPATDGATSVAKAPELSLAEAPIDVLARHAVDGNALARTRLRDEGRVGRRALLALAGADRVRGARALAMLRSFGALRSRTEVDTVATLAADAGLRREAIPLLASDLGPGGARHLGALLAAYGPEGGELVGALKRVAALGRRQAAFDALLAGARAGHADAAAAALEVGGAAGLQTLLDASPTEVIASTVFAEAVRSGARTVRGRTLRIAERGDTRALRLGAAAGLKGIVPLLEARTRVEDAGVAADAVTTLATIDDPRALIAIARALEGPAAEAAATALAGAKPEAVDELAGVARRSSRDASAALMALAVMGGPGVERLGALADVPALARAAITALAAATDATASTVLGRVAERPAQRFEVIAALATRLRAGDEGAGSMLVTLAQGPAGRAALRALSECGEAGVRWMREAERVPALSRRAREWLGRMGSEAAAPARAAPRGFAGRRQSTQRKSAF